MNWSSSITRDDVSGRSHSAKLSLTDPQNALKVARSIRHPWYRCQALSNVAEHWGTKRQKLALLEEAFAAAQEQPEINRVVTVSAWPLAVLVGIDPANTQEHLQRLTQLAEREAHSLRRADALFAVANAVKGDPSLLALVVPALSRALLSGRGWRIDRLIRKSVETVLVSMRDVADQLIAHHSDGGKKTALIESLRSAHR